jgi:hypothetical protein
VVGVDENQNVSPLAGAAQVPNQLQLGSPISVDNSNSDMDVENKKVTMVVLDRIVIEPMVNFVNKIRYITKTNLAFIALCY